MKTSPGVAKTTVVLYLVHVGKTCQNPHDFARVRVRLGSYSSLSRFSAPYTSGRRISLASKFRPCYTSELHTSPPEKKAPKKWPNADEAAIASVSVPGYGVLMFSMASAKILNDSSQHFDYRSPADLSSVSPASCFPTGPSSSPTSASAFTSLTHINNIIRPTPTPNFPKSDPPYLMVYSFSRRCVTRSSPIHEVRGLYTKVGAIRETTLEDSIVQEQNCCPTDLCNCFQQTFPDLYSTRPPE